MRRRLLIVEDDLWIRTLLADLFRDEGYLVMLANDGRAALDKLASARPR